MIGWTALVPIKAPADRKTRLAPHLSPAEREALTDDMLAHVAEVLKASPSVARAILLSPEPPEDGFDGWIADEGRGLNAELEGARAHLDCDLLVLHADLPRLTVHDVETLLADAVDVAAIVPDRHHVGTNAIALPAGAAFTFAFGENSFAAHRAKPGTLIVESPGLMHDVDRIEDLIG
ncbi:2-phospho-L-lactate guanylyltransferase [Sphingomonas montanisoli]|uniref:2-phospho-L-lactate guanylyltransferase n=1 Tax=Sphingomonas montanisoli TaxID=2606412 RepID=A0A5D9BXM3_9SPHN|nr:2-phospho-L-lactate guanylyltransferase [Sphingomonas montanisoli]TZG24154.1 2-phospho-L-lactate guanylyltransferase [Sphingomonas montanisoli]